MTNPQFIEEKPLSLADAKKIITDIEKRDKELGFLSNRAKEHLDGFVTLSDEEKDKLHKELVGLKLTRLKEEHFAKIIDFLPTTVNDLKVVLQAYPLSLPKKDQEAIIGVVKKFA